MRTLPAVLSGSHPADELALIDISGLLHGRDTKTVARQIDAACRSLGFFRVTGHGVDSTLLARMEALARATIRFGLI